MRNTRGIALCLGLLPATAMLMRAPAAQGADAGDLRPDCPTGDVVVVAGGDPPLLKALAQQLALDPNKITIIQVPTQSCTAIAWLNDPNKTVTDPGNTADSAAFYDSNGVSAQCKLAPTKVDVAFSDSFATTCSINVAGDVGDFFGPVSPQVFVVPSTSSQKAISAEAAYSAFGVYNGAAKPWIDKAFFSIRTETSGTQQVISSMIGVPANQWWGAKKGGSSRIIPELINVGKGLNPDGTTPTGGADPTLAEKAIGTLPSENAQPPATKANIRILAYQGHGQIAAFYPDSSVDKLDKRNVRDGHYELWGPLHLFSHVDTATGAPVSRSKPIVDRFTGELTKLVLDGIADNFLVPRCAMKVRRTTEGGPLSSYTPDKSCACYFDSKPERGGTTCKACTTDTDCPTATPKCNYNYCEVR